MINIEKYLSEEEIKKLKKPRPLVEVSMKVTSVDELYQDSLIAGGTGIDATMKMVMQAANGEETTPMQPYHGSNSDGMTIL